jgi:hypothetical protein
MRIKQEVKKIIHQNIEEYALKVNKSSSTGSMSTFSEKINKIKEEIENLTPEQRSQGYEAELRNRLNEQEKAYKEAYSQFLEEHQTYKEKELAIVKKYADLMTKAQTEAEQKRVEEAKNRELGSLSMDMFMSGDEWKIAFGELEYFSHPTQKVFLKGWMNRMADLKKWNEKFVK